MNPATATAHRILIVEDDADAARQLENLLRAAHFQLIGSVSTGQEALLLAESSRPDLVIMDIVLPGDLDGIQTATLLAERHDTPVLYLTAYSDEELYERARATLPLAYLSKPFDDRALQRAIALALDRHALLTRLKASQAQLAEAQAVAHMGSWYWNLADDRIDVSDELLRLFELAPGSFEPRFDTFLHLACAADRPKMLATVETLLAGKDPGDVDIRLDRPDTSPCVLRVRSSARFDAQGHAIALLGTARDVTSEWRAKREAEAYRKQLEEQVARRTAELSTTNARLQDEIADRIKLAASLLTSEQRYRGLVDNLPEPLLVMQDDCIVFANPALARLLGFPVTTAVLGMPLAKLLHADSRQACEQCKQATFAGQVTSTPTVLKLQRADGGSVEVEVLTFAFDYEGRPALLAVMRDLTARRVMEQVAERFRVALDSSPDAVYLIDPESMRFIDINATALRVLGYSREELLCLGPQDIKPNFNKDMLRARFNAVIAGEPGAEVLQTMHQRKDASTFPVEIRMRAFASAGQPLIVAVVRDISERTRAESELRETQARFRQLAGSIDEAFWIRDLVENRFLYANPAYERLYGKSVDSLYRHPRSFLASVHPDDRDRVAAAYDAQGAQPGGLDHEYRVVIGKQVRWLWVRTFPIHDADGKVYRTIGLAQDVTQRRESEEQYRSIIQTSMDGFWLTSAQGRLLDCNEAYCRMMGYSREEMLAFSIGDLEAKESAAETAKHIRVLMDQGYDRFESQHRHKDGHLIELEISAYFRPDAQGGQIFSFLRDITERKQIEENLRLSEARSRSVLRAAPVGIGMLVERVFQEVNDTMLSMTGYSRDELLGKSARLLYPSQADFDYVGTEKYWQIRAHGIGSVETRWQRKDGKIIDVALSSSPILPDDLSHGVTFTALDITASKQAEQERLAHEANQRDALVREVHHRIKNNLQGVIGLLRQDIADHPQTQVALENAIAQINTIAVVHGLQSRMPQNELRLRELLHEVSGAAAALAVLPQHPSLDDSLTGDVWLDNNAAVSIALILNELIHNAVKHCQNADGAGVQISLSGDSQHATVRIINPGGPLPANFDLASGAGCGTGLDLIRTLLPRRGATLKISNGVGCIETELLLCPPLTTEPELPV